jgi:hypothetical protein
MYDTGRGTNSSPCEPTGVRTKKRASEMLCGRGKPGETAALNSPIFHTAKLMGRKIKC